MSTLNMTWENYLDPHDGPLKFKSLESLCPTTLDKTMGRREIPKGRKGLSSHAVHDKLESGKLWHHFDHLVCINQ